jgi:hypothetical protein
MKKLLPFIFLLTAIVSHAQQKQTYDIATFTVPYSWNKDASKSGLMSYTSLNNAKGTYCQVGIYKSMGTLGSAQLDFDTEWNDLVAKPYKVSVKPEVGPSAIEDGWEAKSGVAPFEFNGAQAAAMLVTMSGHATRMSILILTNTDVYNAEIEKFLESVDLKKPVGNTQPVVANNTNSSTNSNTKNNTVTQANTIKASGSFAFTTTNFDDGWTSTVQEDWALVTKGNIRVLVHYPNKDADAYNTSLMDGLKTAWDILVAPRYSSASNMEFKPISSWQSIEFGEADMVEKGTSKTVHVVLFKVHYSGGNGRYVEFITPDKTTFEGEFGAYHETSYGWEKMEAMAGYNKFAVAASDLTGKWTNKYSGMTHYVNAYTGASAGADTHASTENFEFFANGTYKWDLAVASGFVGNIKFQTVKSSGKHTLPNNWQVQFSDLEGKPKLYNAYFSCIKGARLLWLQDTSYGGYSSYGKVE